MQHRGQHKGQQQSRNDEQRESRYGQQGSSRSGYGRDEMREQYDRDDDGGFGRDEEVRQFESPRGGQFGGQDDAYRTQRQGSQQRGFYDERDDYAQSGFRQSGGRGEARDIGRYGSSRDWGQGRDSGSNDRGRFAQFGQRSDIGQTSSHDAWTRGNQSYDQGRYASTEGQYGSGSYNPGRFNEDRFNRGSSDTLFGDRNEKNHTGRGPRGYKRSDERIREDVSDRLMHDSQIDASDIEVKVSEGTVTLEGTVDSRRIKHMAEDLAESVSGVQDVVNHIRVKRESESATSSSQQGASSSTESGAQRPRNGTSARS